MEADPLRAAAERRNMNQPPYELDGDSRAAVLLNQLGRDEPGRRRWARHGSTRWLWKDEDVREAIRLLGGRALKAGDRSLTLAAQLRVAVPLLCRVPP